MSGTNTSGPIPSGTSIVDRYIISEQIGSGGMGTIYRAFDSKLNRNVALKILSLARQNKIYSERAGTRLLKEAQALAKLSHPNVVAVHDVGYFGDDIFIAMELVEGITLRDWIAEQQESAGTAARGPRPYNKVIEIMSEAGRGLAAAHKAGLIHRDFKPFNVIIGNDGRVRVLDFGLARAIDSVENDDLSDLVIPRGNSDTTLNLNSDFTINQLDVPLSKTGGILGSPLYMSPEQHMGSAIDEYTDQFSFCVVLYEALYGKRPFSGSTLKKLQKRVLNNRISMPPNNSDVPLWLRDVVLRGLSLSPVDRYDSMDHLLDALQRDPSIVTKKSRPINYRTIFVLILVLMAVIVPVGLWYGVHQNTINSCKSIDGHLTGVWDKATKQSIRKSFFSTKKPYASATWKRVEKYLDEIFFYKLSQISSNFCDTRYLHGTISDDLFELRMQCLRGCVSEMGAVTKQFLNATPAVLQNAVEAVYSVKNLDTCSDKYLNHSFFNSPDDDLRAQIDSLHTKLDLVVAYKLTGQYEKGLSMAKNLLTKAKSVNFLPFQTKVAFEYGLLLERTGDFNNAESVLSDVVRQAGEIKNTMLAAKAMAWLVWVVGYQLGRYKEGIVFAQNAEAMLSIAGDNPEVRSQLYNSLGGLYISMSDYDKALEYVQKALDIRKSYLDSDHVLISQSINNIGFLLERQGKLLSALDHYKISMDILAKALGPQHPTMANTLINIGQVNAKLGNNNEALKFFRRSLLIRKSELGKDHPSVAHSLDKIGHLLIAIGNYDNAVRNLKMALAIRENAFGPKHPLLISPLTGIGQAYFLSHRFSNGLNSLERALSICEESDCKEHEYAQALFLTSRVVARLNGDKSKAVRLAEKAKEKFSKSAYHKKELTEVEKWLNGILNGGVSRNH